MDKKKELPKDLVLVTKLASGITSVVSITYMILSIFGLIFYFNCDVELSDSHSKHFWSTIYQAYLQNSECNDQSQILPEITKPHTIFVLISITLCFSIVTLLTSATLFFLINGPNKVDNFKIYIYVYIFSWVGALVVDLTLGSHFGVDVVHLAKLLDESSIHNSRTDILRIGAFLLMTIVLKGYIIHLVTLVAIVLMIIFLYQYQKEIDKEMHSMNSQRVLEAFGSFENSVLENDSPSSPENKFGSTFLVDDNPPRPRPDTNSFVEQFYRLTWKSPDKQPAAQAQQHRMDSPIPLFQRNVPERMLTHTKDRTATRPNKIIRVPVPAPDYSPHSQRRLKSVLKPY